MKNHGHNLKLPIATVLLVLGIGPLLVRGIYTTLRLRGLILRNPVEVDLGFLRDKYDALSILMGCVLTLPILIAISRSPKWARVCARDPARLSQTISSARWTSWIVAAMALVAMVYLIHELVS